jgi:restriction endonuclease Mrr
VTLIKKRIVLIDGEQLVRLMMEWFWSRTSTV